MLCRQFFPFITLKQTIFFSQLQLVKNFFMKKVTPPIKNNGPSLSRKSFHLNILSYRFQLQFFFLTRRSPEKYSLQFESNSSCTLTLAQHRSKMASSTQRIMLFYQWDSQKEVLRIKEALVAQGYKVWMDIDKMHGDIYKSMAKGVESASLLIICMSPQYQKSECCNR